MSDNRSDKFTAEPGAIVPVTQCVYCRHLAPGSIGGWACKAFLGGIPDAILVNRVDHRRPFEGDEGIRFEVKPGASAESLASLYRDLDALADRGGR